MMHNPNASPFQPVPAPVLLVAGALFAVECLFAAGEAGFIGGPGAVGWRLDAIRHYGFSGPAFDWMIQNRRFPLEHMQRFVTYPFVHYGFGHAVFASVLILAVGKSVCLSLGGWCFLTVVIGSTIFGAVAYGLFTDTRVALVGGYPPAYGVIGAFTFILWMEARIKNEPAIRAFFLIGFLAAFQIVLWLFFGAGGLAWIADFAGFFFGLGVMFLLVPGGVRSALALLRRR